MSEPAVMYLARLRARQQALGDRLCVRAITHEAEVARWMYAEAMR